MVHSVYFVTLRSQVNLRRPLHGLEWALRTTISPSSTPAAGPSLLSTLWSSIDEARRCIMSYLLDVMAAEPEQTSCIVTHTYSIRFTVAVWRSGRALVSISEVNLRRARLVLGWVTVFGFNSRDLSRHVTSHSGQLNQAIPSWVGTMSKTLWSPYYKRAIGLSQRFRDVALRNSRYFTRHRDHRYSWCFRFTLWLDDSMLLVIKLRHISVGLA